MSGENAHPREEGEIISNAEGKLHCNNLQCNAGVHHANTRTQIAGREICSIFPASNLLFQSTALFDDISLGLYATAVSTVRMKLCCVSS